MDGKLSDDYSVESLVTRFETHLQNYLKEKKEREEKHEKEYGTSLPKYGSDPDFCLIKALINICQEISELKKTK